MEHAAVKAAALIALLSATAHAELQKEIVAERKLLKDVGMRGCSGE